MLSDVPHKCFQIFPSALHICFEVYFKSIAQMLSDFSHACFQILYTHCTNAFRYFQMHRTNAYFQMHCTNAFNYFQTHYTNASKYFQMLYISHKGIFSNAQILSSILKRNPTLLYRFSNALLKYFQLIAHMFSNITAQMFYQSALLSMTSFSQIT